MANDSEYTNLLSDKTDLFDVDVNSKQVNLAFKDNFSNSINVNVNASNDEKISKTIINRNSGWNATYVSLNPKSFAYKSSNNNIAYVDSDGYIRGVNAGATTITVSVGDKFVTYNVTVTGKVKSSKGDVDGDGRITLFDVILILKKYFSIYQEVRYEESFIYNFLIAYIFNIYKCKC